MEFYFALCSHVTLHTRCKQAKAMTDFVGSYLRTVDKAGVCVSYFTVSAALLKKILHAYLVKLGISGRFTAYKFFCVTTWVNVCRSYTGPMGVLGTERRIL